MNTQRLTIQPLRLTAYGFAVVLEAVYGFFAAWGIARLRPGFSFSTQVWWPEAAQRGLRPEFDTWLYLFFILSAVAASLAVRRMFVTQGPVKERWKSFWVIETILVTLIVCAAFKIIIYDYRPQLAQLIFYGLLIVSLLHKLMPKAAWEQWQMLRGFWTYPGNRPLVMRWADAACLAVILGVIFIPYPEAMLARMFVGEQCHHFNHAVMGPAWAFLKGSVLNVDVISPYGLGLPIFLAFVATLLGGFSYEHMVLAMIVVHMAYFAGWYLVLRGWWGSAALALAAVLWSIKVQMFHVGVYPIVYTYPSATIIRYCFDVLFFFLIWKHLATGRKPFLLCAGALSGFAVFYLTDTGVYLIATYFCYILLNMLKPQWRVRLMANLRAWPAVAWLCVIPFVVLFFVLAVFNSNKWMSPQFLGNMKEFIEYFISGFGLTPMTESLMYRNFCASAVGFFIPVVYVLTMVVVASLCFLDKIRRENLFVVILCVYGLGIFHYYVARSAVTSYYAVGVPYVVIVFFWIKTLAGRLAPRWRTPAVAAILVLVIYSLWTSHNFTSYPNLFNLSKNPMTDPLVAQPLPNNRKTYFHHLWHDYPQELRLAKNFAGETDERLVTDADFLSDDDLVGYFRRESDFKEDAGMIKSMTSPKDKVALLSSFDVKILMEADRKPFFYYFPIANERPMYMRTFFVERFYTLNELKRVIGQLENEKPRYVFMEKILLATEVPAGYDFHLYGIMRVLEYVRQHYAPVSEGKYLVGLERKN